jgi:hypothetical protein
MISPNYILSENSPLSKLFCSSSYIASGIGSNNESIFRRTLIDCSKNNFDFAIIGWSHPERSVILDKKIDVDYVKLKEESEKDFLGVAPNRGLYSYIDNIPSQNVGNYSLLKFEPKGTDDTIFYTLSLHNFFKQKGIPHLFLNMGKLDSDILFARESWLEGIDPKNYLSVDDTDDILKKMSFCFTEYYAKKAEKTIVKDLKIHEFKSLSGNSDKEYEKTGWIMDVGGHLGELAYNDLLNLICNYIIKSNLII